MDKLTKFLIRVRLTNQVSNQQLLALIKLCVDSYDINKEGLSFLRKEFTPEKFNQFLLLFSHTNIIGIKALNFLDDCYPEQLRNIYNPPALLFYEGDKNLLLTKCLAIVGSRNASDYSYGCINGLVPKIIQEYTIVSGLAAGVDSWAHQAALNCGGKTIAVIGSGLDVCYPKVNSTLQASICRLGLVISEYPPKSSIQRWHFPQRNRIIAGLSQKVVITEAKARSGALITAQMALDSNRDVYAVPGRIDSSLSLGCNQLISQGAIPLINLNEL